MEGVEDIPGSALAEGIRWEWESFGEYLDALERMPRAVDVGTHVPHAAMRAYVMGERADDPATADDLDAMQRIVRARSVPARSASPPAAPPATVTCTASRSRARSRPRTEIDALLEAMVRRRAACCSSCRPASRARSAATAPARWRRSSSGWSATGRRTSSRSRSSRCRAAPTRTGGDRGSRPQRRERRGRTPAPAGREPVLRRADGSPVAVNPFQYFPTYRPLLDLPFAERIRRLATPGGARRDPRRAPGVHRPARARPSRPALVRRSCSRSVDRSTTSRAPDASVGAIARRTGEDPWAVAYDLLLGSDGREFLLFPLLNYAGGSYDGVHDMMADPMTVQGLGDGGAHCGVICDASMTTYLLSHWTRDRTRGPRFPVEWAVRRLTSDPAALYGLGDRGVVAPGYRADLNVLDADALGLLHPELVADLPGGAGRLVQRSTGYVETIVAGETVVAAGALTDARPGSVVRGPCAAA